MTTDLKGWVRPRPLRVAFLVEDGEHAQLALDGIFADCYDRWGGRFSLIVPCQGQRISTGYWPWLEAYDADIIYSYVPLSQPDVLEIYERLGPSQYLFHEMGRQPRLDVFGFKPSYGFSALSSLSNIFRLARHSRATNGAPPLKIIDSWHTEKHSRFLTDSFGTYLVCRNTGIYPPDATSAATLLTVVSPEKQADRRFGIPQDMDTIPDEMAALTAFVHRKAISFSLASILFAPKLEIMAGDWSSKFNLVIGDSFADRILFWNARLLIPAWLDTDLCCFRVTSDQLENAEFLMLLGELLKRRNHVNAGSGGQSQLALRTASLNQKQLDKAHDLLMSTKAWGLVTKRIITSLDDLVPSARNIKDGHEGFGFDSDFFRRTDWIPFTWSSPVAKPPVTFPDHLLDAPPRQAFTMGCWCNDFALEYPEAGPRFSNENGWVLPRRWRMTGAFGMSRIQKPGNFLPPPNRANRYGNLTACVNTDHAVSTIKVPTAREGIQYALTTDGQWSSAEAERGRIVPPNKAVWASPSNEARYLMGVLGMAGGLESASQVLLHPFLRETFARLGGTPVIPLDKITPTVNRLRKRVQNNPAFDLRDEGERKTLASLIVKAAGALRNHMSFVSYEDLKADWKSYREKYWAAHSELAGSEADAKVGERHEEKSLENCLTELRRHQILFQGHQWTCRQCHHKNWFDLSALSHELSCEVCHNLTTTPIDIRWLFRPNEFLINSLRNHSTLSLVWALSVFRERARRSFLFAEPTWFGFSDESESADAEADLLVVLDGKAVLCEVKSSWQDLRLSDISSFTALAQRLRPDIAILAVMEAGSGPKDALVTAAAELSAANIKFELLTSAHSMPRDDPYLPS